MNSSPTPGMRLAVTQVTSCGVTPLCEDQRKRAHRLVERRARGVALEQLRDRALAGGDDDEVAVGGVALELRHADLGDLDRAAAFGDDLHEARKLDPLIDRLRRRVEPADEAERLVPEPSGAATAMRTPVDRGAASSHRSRPSRRSSARAGREHALARQHLAVGDVRPRCGSAQGGP